MVSRELRDYFWSIFPIRFSKILLMTQGKLVPFLNPSPNLQYLANYTEHGRCVIAVWFDELKGKKNEEQDSEVFLQLENDL